jgi:hypothetical protein
MQDESGRQLSEDGYWYWDGAEWQPVDGQPQYSEQPAEQNTSEQNTSEQDPENRPIAFDPNDFPTLMLYAEYSSLDDLAMSLGIDVATLQTDDDLPVS